MTYIGDVLAKFEILVAMVCIYVAGLLLVVGGVVNDETDRVWSEALLLLHVAVAISNYYKVTGYTKMYQGTKVPPHRYLQYTNIDLYEIHIASSPKNKFDDDGNHFLNDLVDLVSNQNEDKGCGSQVEDWVVIN